MLKRATESGCRRAAGGVKVDGLDLVVPMWLRVSANELGEELKALSDGPQVFEVGDGVLPRTAFEAVQEAAALGHRF
jgi:hypothetical protein